MKARLLLSSDHPSFIKKNSSPRKQKRKRKGEWMEKGEEKGKERYKSGLGGLSTLIKECG
jgi:hypothetical protein